MRLRIHFTTDLFGTTILPSPRNRNPADAKDPHPHVLTAAQTDAWSHLAGSVTGRRRIDLPGVCMRDAIAAIRKLLPDGLRAKLVQESASYSLMELRLIKSTSREND